MQENASLEVILEQKIGIEFKSFFNQDFEPYISHLSAAKKLDIYGLRNLLDSESISSEIEEYENYTVYQLIVGLEDGCDYQRVSAYYSNLSKTIEAYEVVTFCDYQRDPILFLLSNDYSRDIDSNCIVIDVS